MLRHWMITWGSHPPEGFAPRCEEFTHETLGTTYEHVNCVDCLHQIIIDLTKKLDAQTQATLDWESEFKEINKE